MILGPELLWRGKRKGRWSVKGQTKIGGKRRLLQTTVVSGVSCWTASLHVSPRPRRGQVSTNCGAKRRIKITLMLQITSPENVLIVLTDIIMEKWFCGFSYRGKSKVSITSVFSQWLKCIRSILRSAYENCHTKCGNLKYSQAGQMIWFKSDLYW